MAISGYILKIVEKDPFLRLQMRAQEYFNRHQFFSTNKQYIGLFILYTPVSDYILTFVIL